MIKKVGITIFILLLLGIFNASFNTLSTLFFGQIAGDQFNASNFDYLKTSLTFNSAFNVNPYAGLVTFGLICWVWFSDFKKLIVSITTLMLCIGIMASVPINKAYAFAETSDRTEAYTILPNESAFWVPDVGNNKDGQTKFDSEQYQSENKIAAKRFVVPHSKLSNSGGSWGWDMYVPTGRLIIVDRTTYSREWVKSNTRGTAAVDQSFPCQSKEGLDVTAGVSIGATVSEADAAKFLYNFGVNTPAGARNDPQVIFQSVYYGRSLAAVMDDIGRKKVQTLVCNEIASRSIDSVNENSIPMMENIKKATTEYFKSVGITLIFIGWADTLEFDPQIQKAINDHYIAQRLAGDVQILQAINALKVQEGLATGIDKHGLPMVVTPDILNAITSIAKSMQK